jgi:hypothetical protein
MFCLMGNYIAALCNMRDGALVDYDSTRITAESDDDAKRKAEEWAAINLEVIDEPTWLQVVDADGKCILSKLHGSPNA